MKLELKHLAPYLPYGLRAEYKGKIIIIQGLKDSTPWSIQDCAQIDKDTWTYLYDIQPILRRMSDLTPEEKDLFLIENESNHTSNAEEQALREARRTLWFLKKHFDIFNLIPQGLAIDINFLNQ